MLRTKPVKYLYLGLLIISIIGIVIGSFYDYEISSVVYKKDANFSLFVASFHIMFDCAFYNVFFGALIGYGVKKIDKKQGLNVLWIVLGTIGIIVFSYMSGTSIFSSNGIFKYYNPELHINLIVEILIGFVSIIGYGLIGFFFVTKYLNRKNILLFLLLLGSFMLAYFAVTITKEFFVRPRYRIIIKYEDSYNNLFHNWFEPFKDFDYFKNLGVNKENFRSFPSGHTVTSSFMCLQMVYLPKLIDKVKTSQVVLFLFGFISLFVLIFTRINCGAHFLSDCSFAVAIGVIVTYICDFIFYKKIDSISE